METVLPIAAVGLLLLAVLWAVVEIRRAKRPRLGAWGALLSGLLFTAIWRVEDWRGSGRPLSRAFKVRKLAEEEEQPACSA